MALSRASKQTTSQSPQREPPIYKADPTQLLPPDHQLTQSLGNGKKSHTSPAHPPSSSTASQQPAKQPSSAPSSPPCASRTPLSAAPSVSLADTCSPRSYGRRWKRWSGRVSGKGSERDDASMLVRWRCCWGGSWRSCPVTMTVTGGSSCWFWMALISRGRRRRLCCRLWRGWEK